MNTVDNAVRTGPKNCAMSFHAGYPQKLGERLTWLERELNLRTTRLLRLMGVKRAELIRAEADRREWGWSRFLETVVLKRKAQDVENSLREFLAVYRYDTVYIKEHVLNRGDAFPLIVNGYKVTTDAGLITLIRHVDSETFVPAMTAFFCRRSQPS